MNEKAQDVLDLFKGLTPAQAQQLRRQILPTLRELREQIVKGKPVREQSQQAGTENRSGQPVPSGRQHGHRR